MAKTKLFGLLMLLLVLSTIFFLGASTRRAWIQGDILLKESGEALIGLTENFNHVHLTAKQKELARQLAREIDIEFRGAIEASREQGSSFPIVALFLRIRGGMSEDIIPAQPSEKD